MFHSNCAQNNATDETQGPFAGTTHAYFDSLYCRHAPILASSPPLPLILPQLGHVPDVLPAHGAHLARRVRRHRRLVRRRVARARLDARVPREPPPRVDAGRCAPPSPPCLQCVANTGVGSSGDVIVGHFAMTYHEQAAALGIDLDDLFSAMLADGNNTPLDWDIEGREAGAYKCVLLLSVRRREADEGVVNTDMCPHRCSRRTASGGRRERGVGRLRCVPSFFSASHPAHNTGSTHSRILRSEMSLWYVSCRGRGPRGILIGV